MQAILLAGGLGTRLRSVVSDRPKPMALIGDRPFMEYVVHELSRHGITDIIFAVGYKGSMVEEYFGDGSQMTDLAGQRLNIRYAYGDRGQFFCAECRYILPDRLQAACGPSRAAKVRHGPGAAAGFRCVPVWGSCAGEWVPYRL